MAIDWGRGLDFQLQVDGLCLSGWIGQAAGRPAPCGASPVDFESFPGVTAIYEAQRETAAADSTVPTIHDFGPNAFHMEALGTTDLERAVFKMGGPGGQAYWDFGPAKAGYVGEQKDTQFYDGVNNALTLIVIGCQPSSPPQASFPIGSWYGTSTLFLDPSTGNDAAFWVDEYATGLILPNAYPDGIWTIVAIRAGDGVLAGRINNGPDVLQAFTSLTLRDNSDPADGRMGIAGGRGAGDIGYWRGAIAAIATYNAKLSDTDLGALMPAKMAQYGVA